MEQASVYHGENLLTILAEKNMSRKDFMHKMGWNFPNQVEKFMRGNPVASTIAKAASVLGVSVSSFFNENVEKKETANINNGISMNSFNKSDGVHRLIDIMEKKLDTRDREDSRSNEVTDRYISHLEQQIVYLEEQLKAALAR